MWCSYSIWSILDAHSQIIQNKIQILEFNLLNVKLKQRSMCRCNAKWREMKANESRSLLTTLSEGIASGSSRTDTYWVTIIKFTEGTLTTGVTVTGVVRHLAVSEWVSTVGRGTTANCTVVGHFTHCIATTAAWVLALVVDAGLGGWACTVVTATHSYQGCW